MKELTSTTGGRYLFFDDIVDLQNSALASAAAMFFGKGNFVISGCQVSDNTISAGFVYLDGKIREVPATGNLNFPVYIIPKNTTEQGMYLDSLTEQDTAVNYGVQFTTTASENGIRITSAGPASKMEEALFSNLNINGSLSLTDINVSGDVVLESQDTSGNYGHMAFSDSGFEFDNDINVDGDVIAKGFYGNSLKITTTPGINTGMSVLEDSIVFTANEAGTSTVSIVFNEYGTVFSSHSEMKDYLKVTSASAASHNAMFTHHGVIYSMTDKQVINWGADNSNAAYLRTEMPFTVAGINGDDAVLNVQKQATRSDEYTNKTVITESSILSYSPATQEYNQNYSGLDLLGGNAKLYIHGHMYDVGVSAKGFFYDKNNSEFVDPIAAGDEGGTATANVNVNTLSQVSTINWKKTITDSTYTGVLTIGADGLAYDGNMKVGGSLAITGGLTVGGVGEINDLRANAISIKNNGSFVAGKPGVTTVRTHTNFRFQITQGSTTSSRVIRLIADRIDCTFIGGVLTATTTTAGEVLSGFTTPHPSELVTS